MPSRLAVIAGVVSGLLLGVGGFTFSDALSLDHTRKGQLALGGR